MELNHLPPGYEPDELPMLYTAMKRTKEEPRLPIARGREFYLLTLSYETLIFVSQLLFLVYVHFNQVHIPDQGVASRSRFPCCRTRPILLFRLA